MFLKNQPRSSLAKAYTTAFQNHTGIKKIKIYQFDNGIGVKVSNSNSFLEKSNSTVKDSIKFKGIKFNVDSKALKDCQKKLKKLNLILIVTHSRIASLPLELKKLIALNITL